MSTILLATDGSSNAEAATEQAFDLARATGWPLHIVVVARVPSLVGYGYSAYAPISDVAEVERESAEWVAHDIEKRATRAGIAVGVEVREGVTADEICAAAREQCAKIIVLGSHGWGGFKRLVIGSVSTAVLHNAPCGVLVVRQPPEEDSH